jgi:hypothetical protein
LVRKFAHVSDLSARLQLEEQAALERPDPDSHGSEAVNWWSLLKTGFEVLEYEDPHEDPSLRLSGRPWRVLRDGSMRIPVFRKRNGKPELKGQHYARMAAYCHLVEVAEDKSAPYGIVLFADGYSGVTVPNSDNNAELFFDGLKRARQTIRSLRADPQGPDEPHDTGRCLRCPHGYPTVCKQSEAKRPTQGTNGRLYRSPCGERFDWVPPHEVAAEKGICTL